MLIQINYCRKGINGITLGSRRFPFGKLDLCALPIREVITISFNFIFLAICKELVSAQLLYRSRCIHRTSSAYQ